MSQVNIRLIGLLRVSTLHFFTINKDDEKLVPHSRLSLPHCPVDMTFDPDGRLWVLTDCRDDPLHVYTHRDGWEVRVLNTRQNDQSGGWKLHVQPKS